LSSPHRINLDMLARLANLHLWPASRRHFIAARFVRDRALSPSPNVTDSRSNFSLFFFPNNRPLVSCTDLPCRPPRHFYYALPCHTNTHMSILPIFDLLNGTFSLPSSRSLPRPGGCYPPPPPPPPPPPHPPRDCGDPFFSSGAGECHFLVHACPDFFPISLNQPFRPTSSPAGLPVTIYVWDIDTIRFPSSASSSRNGFMISPEIITSPLLLQAPRLPPFFFFFIVLLRPPHRSDGRPSTFWFCLRPRP